MADAILPPEFLDSGPIVIAATGGSGTRVVANIVRSSGVFLGEQLNKASDAFEIGRTGAPWINAFMAAELNQTQADEEKIRADLKPVFEKHVAPLRDNPRPWGWKAPRSIYLLPLFRKWFPALKFIHLVRDGRDMAFSMNQRQLRNYGATLLKDLPPASAEPVRAIALWSKVNLMRADFGERELGARYLRIRFEDLCAKPVPAIERILNFIGTSGDVEAIAKREVAPPATIGRWRSQDRQVIAEMHGVGESALRKFGYLDGEVARPN
jgi:hypothetical protein